MLFYIFSRPRQRLIIALHILLALTHSATALDCDKATGKIENLICADKEARLVDAAMSSTYFTTLKHLSGISHDLLQNSQRIWLAKTLPDCLNNEDEARPYVFQECVVDTIGERREEILRDFPIIGYAGEADPRDKQRTKLPLNGNFAGAWQTRAHWDGHEIIAGYVLFQSGTRVCGRSVDWATNREYSNRIIGTADGDILHVTFSCANPDNAQAPCEDREDRHLPLWSNTSESITICNNHLQLSETSSPLRCEHMRRGYSADDQKLRGEAWIEKCLTDPSYPQQKDIQK